MLHAIEPGHGKSLVTVYLVGNRSTWQQAIGLGIVVAFSHTFSVLAIGSLSALVLQQWTNSQEELIHWVEIISGALIVGVGAMMLWRASKNPLSKPSETVGGDTISTNDEPHCHHKHCDFDESSPPSTLKEIFMLGIASGFCPSPLPLVLLMSSLSISGFGNMGQAVGYLFAFSLGLASMITGFGLILIQSRKASLPWLNKLSPLWARRINQISALLIIGVGLYLIFFAESAGHLSLHLSHHLPVK